MTRINHQRPIFRLLASLKAEKAITLSKGLVALEAKYSPKPSGGPITRKPTTAEEREIIHEIAVGIFDHIEKHHDVRMVRKLFEHIENEADRLALRAWFCAYGQLESISQEMPLIFSRTKPANRSAALRNPFWTMTKKEPRISPMFNFVIELERLIGKATEKSLMPRTGDEIDVELLARIKRVMRER